MEDPQANWKPAAYTQVQRDDLIGRSLRTERWRYTEWDGGRHGAELYDHDTDPQEHHNLAGDADWADVQMELRGLLQKNAANGAP